jgi:hypothetical protein
MLRIKALIYFAIINFSLLIFHKASAQDSSRIRISLLTCTPGEELYSIFGHSALRVIDSNSVTDIVYNYGTFNFDDEGFYLKFIRGKLLYSLSIESFNDFKFEYQLSNRGITEQVLAFSPLEKINLQHALIENLKEENRYYKYDFFLDNCTTRLRDLILKNKNPKPILPAVMPAGYTFRNAIHQYLNAGKQYWSKLGIDILLGAKADAVMTSSQQDFLPDNLMNALNQTKNISIVQSSKNLFEIQKTANKVWFTPTLFFWLLLAFYILIAIPKNTFFIRLRTFFDFLLFFVTGLLGVILIFMWFGTDHSMTKNNYNLLWALPTHIFGAFLINSKKVIAKKYFLFTPSLLILLLPAWYFMPQQLNTALIPFTLLLLFRSMVIRFK